MLHSEIYPCLADSLSSSFEIPHNELFLIMSSSSLDHRIRDPTDTISGEAAWVKTDSVGAIRPENESPPPEKRTQGKDFRGFVAGVFSGIAKLSGEFIAT